MQLQKNHYINLSKIGNLENIYDIELEWHDKPQSKGFLGLFIPEIQLDCDIALVMLNSENKLVDKLHVVYFGNKRSPDGAIVHHGDHIEDDNKFERVTIDLCKVSDDAMKVVVYINLYGSKQRKHQFSQLNHATIRLKHVETEETFIEFTLHDHFATDTSVRVARFERHQGQWLLRALGEGSQDKSLSDIVERYK